MNALANLPARLPMPPTVTQQGITPAQWKVLTEAIFPGAQTPEAVELAIAYCKSRNLDIMKRPVHIVPVYSKEKKATVETIWPGVSEIQVTAARTKQWAGMDPPRFGPDITRDFANDKGEVTSVTFPEYAEVTVYRMVDGQRCGFTETCFWEETYSKRSRWDETPNEMWQRRARSQLAKCAKAMSLRAAFPEEGEYTAEEMEGKEVAHGGVVIDAKAEPVAPEPAPKARTIKLYATDGSVVEEFDRISAFLDGFEKWWKTDREHFSHAGNVRTLEQIVERTDPGQVRELVETWLAELREDIAAVEAG
jgi:phage recombination protein Bet